MAECNKLDAITLTKTDIKALQNHLFSMYKDIEAICIRHNLTISLAFGNVIGAIRHGGWIPWDDDLDVYMSRKDYDKFVKIYATELPDKYIVYSLESAEGPIVRFTKVIDKTTVFSNFTDLAPKHVDGVFIDIFPLDDVPQNRFVHQIKKIMAFGIIFIQNSILQRKFASKEYKEVMYASFGGKRLYWIKNIMGFIFGTISLKTWFVILDKLIKNFNNSNYIYCGISTKKGWNPMPKEYVFPPKKFKFSNGDEAFIPCQAKKYLTDVYGNWQKVPDDGEKWHHYCKEFYLPPKK